MAGGGVLGFLREWAERYVRHRDISRKIVEIRESGHGFAVVNSDGSSLECYVLPSLSSGDAAEAIKNAGIIVTLSNDENIKAVYGMWDSLAGNSRLVIVFANPFSNVEDKWVLKPSLHDRVCDRGSLLQGLKAMAELVEPVDEAAFALKSQAIERQD